MANDHFYMVVIQPIRLAEIENMDAGIINYEVPVPVYNVRYINIEWSGDMYLYYLISL